MGAATTTQQRYGSMISSIGIGHALAVNSLNEWRRQPRKIVKHEYPFIKWLTAVAVGGGRGQCAWKDLQYSTVHLFLRKSSWSSVLTGEGNWIGRILLSVAIEWRHRMNNRRSLRLQEDLGRFLCLVDHNWVSNCGWICWTSFAEETGYWEDGSGEEEREWIGIDHN